MCGLACFWRNSLQYSVYNLRIDHGIQEERIKHKIFIKLTLLSTGTKQSSSYYTGQKNVEHQLHQLLGIIKCSNHHSSQDEHDSKFAKHLLD